MGQEQRCVIFIYRLPAFITCDRSIHSLFDRLIHDRFHLFDGRGNFPSIILQHFFIVEYAHCADAVYQAVKASMYCT